jgi:hypothetical protein
VGVGGGVVDLNPGGEPAVLPSTLLGTGRTRR